MCASKHGLGSLTVLVDYNRQQSYGSAREVQDMEPFADKWRSFGFGTTEIDGHDVDALRAALGGLLLESGRPSAIVCHTVKGRGVPFVEGNPEWHHKNRVTDEEVEALLAALGDV
jgi:transketolase